MWIYIYALLFVFTFVISFILTPLCRTLAIRLNIVDQPGERKIHQVSKPYLGGLAIYLTMTLVLGLGVVAALYFLPNNPNLPLEVTPYLPNVRKVLPKIIALLLGGTIIFLLGLWDDIKRLSPLLKLIGQIIAAVLVVSMGIRLDLFINNHWISGFLTVLWIVAITNSFNLMDNMDGLSAGVAGIATILFIWFSYQAGHTYMLLILIVFLGSTLGFLPYNFPPSTIFMGDAGSMFLGFQLGALTVLNSYYYKDAPTHLPIMLPFFVLSVPLFDTITVMAIRIKNGKPIYQGDTNHFSHRLVALGMTQRQAVLCIYLVTFCTGTGALLLRKLEFRESLLVLSQMVAIFAIIAILEFTGRRNK